MPEKPTRTINDIRPGRNIDGVAAPGQSAPATAAPVAEAPVAEVKAAAATKPVKTKTKSSRRKWPWILLMVILLLGGAGFWAIKYYEIDLSQFIPV